MKKSPAPIPLDPIENAAVRRRTLDICQVSREARKSVFEACRDDFVYFVSLMAWCFEPREREVRPFVPWECQIPHLKAIAENVGVQDVAAIKTRDFGYTWMGCYVATWLYVFRPRAVVGIGSYEKADVDATEDPGALLWKIRFALNHLPDWLRPDTDDRLFRLYNRDNASVIAGYSAKHTIARGDRFLWFWFDEFAFYKDGQDTAALASTQYTTKSRLFVSTPNGARGEFYNMHHDPKRALLRLRLHWTDHPPRFAGMYRSTSKGKIIILDKGYKFPADYNFVADERTRSPWYDVEYARSPTPQLSSQELDCDFIGSGSPIVPRAIIDRLVASTAEDPKEEGIMLLDDGGGPLYVPTEKGRGRLRLWFHLGAGRRPPDGRYVIGCDVAWGGGATTSYSTMCVFDAHTGRKVAEFSDHTIAAYQFADIAVATARWFHNAKLIWEAQGPGGSFFDRIEQLRHTNYFYRMQEDNIRKTMRGRAKKPGVSFNQGQSGTTKARVLTEYVRALSAGEFINPSKWALEEIMAYVLVDGNHVEHVAAMSSTDPTGKGKSHGDVVIADALAWRAAREMRQPGATKATLPPLPPKTRIDECPLGSFGWRRSKWEDKVKGKGRRRASQRPLF